MNLIDYDVLKLNLKPVNEERILINTAFARFGYTSDIPVNPSVNL